MKHKRLEDYSYNKKEEKKEKEKPKKGFWDKAWSKSKLEKKSTVAVLYLRENGTAEPMEIRSERGFFNINGKTYHERRDCIYTINKERYPLAIIPEFSITPFGRKEWYDKKPQEIISILQDHCMKGIRHAERVRSGESDIGNKISIKTAIIIGIVLIILVAIIMGYK